MWGVLSLKLYTHHDTFGPGMRVRGRRGDKIRRKTSLKTQNFTDATWNTFRDATQNIHRTLQMTFETLTDLSSYSRHTKHSQNVTVVIQNSHRTLQSSLKTLTEVYRRHSRHSQNFTVATPKHSQLQWTLKTNAKAICLTCNTQEKHIIQHKARTFSLS